MSQPLKIAWKLETADPRVASIRYRAFIPAFHLQKSQVKCFFYDGENFINFDKKPDVVIFVKCFSAHDLLLAQEAQRRGIPVFLDLCDNIFEDSRGNARCFGQMAAIAQKVVVTTTKLATLLREKFGIADKIQIIEDTYETAETTAFTFKNSKSIRMTYYFSNGPMWFLVEASLGLLRGVCNVFAKYFALAGFRILRWDNLYAQGLYRLLRFLRLDNKIGFAGTVLKTKASVTTSKKAKRSAEKLPVVLWYGRSGIPGEWGMTDILLVESALEKVFQRHPFELVVLSNNFELFKQRISPMTVPTRYVEWKLETADQILSSAKVVIVPNPQTEFSINKSPNRTVQALAGGANVVATKTPALSVFEGAMFFDDFEAGLLQYLENRQIAKAHLEKAREIISVHFAQENSARQWLKLILPVVQREIRPAIVSAMATSPA